MAKTLFRGATENNKVAQFQVGYMPSPGIQLREPFQ